MRDVIRGCLLALFVLWLAVLLGGCGRQPPAEAEAPTLAIAAMVPAGQAEHPGEAAQVSALVQRTNLQSGGRLAAQTDLILLSHALQRTLRREGVPPEQWSLRVPELLRHHMQLADRLHLPEQDDRLRQPMERVGKALRSGGGPVFEAELRDAVALSGQNVRLAEQQLMRARRQAAGLTAAQASAALAGMAWAEGARLLEQAFELRRDDISPETVGWLLDAGQAWADAADAEAARRVLAHAHQAVQAAKVQSEPAWVPVLAQLHLRSGDGLWAQGDTSGAQRHYAALVELRRSLARADAAAAEPRLELAASLDRLGDAQRLRGDLVAALRTHREALGLRQMLNRGAHASALSTRDLSVSHNKVGDVLQDMGDWQGALRSYRSGRALMEQLSAQDPEHPLWKRDLSVSHDRMGDAFKAQGEVRAALAAYLDGLSIRQALAARHPQRAEWRLDVVVSCWKITQLGAAAGSVEHRRSWLQTGLGILRQLRQQGQLPAAREGWIRMFEEALAELA